MTKADKALARQAWTENDWDGHVDIPKLIQLVRADEKEACAKVVDAIEAQCITDDVDDPPLAHVAAAIRARGQHDSL